jgi:hypothetical protein
MNIIEGCRSFSRTGVDDNDYKVPFRFTGKIDKPQRRLATASRPPWPTSCLRFASPTMHDDRDPFRAPAREPKPGTFHRPAHGFGVKRVPEAEVKRPDERRAEARRGTSGTPPCRERRSHEREAVTARLPHGGLIVAPHPVTRGKLIIDLAAHDRLPAIYPFRFHAKDGGLVSYGIDQVDQWRSAATYVDRILRGTNAKDLPVQQPTKYELVINLKTAKALGLEVSPTLLARADEVIE